MNDSDNINTKAILLTLFQSPKHILVTATLALLTHIKLLHRPQCYTYQIFIPVKHPSTRNFRYRVPEMSQVLSLCSFVPIPSPTPKRGKKSGSKKFRNLATNSQPARSLDDQENTPNTSSSTSQVVASTKAKRGKIQVQNSSRVLRPRGCQLSGETPYWVVSWDEWANTRQPFS